MTSRYTAFPKDFCPNVSSPCWIPQADNIIHEHIIRALPQCDTIDKYSCMLNTIRRDSFEIDQKCMKSCKAESYKTSSIENNMDAFNSVSYNLSNTDFNLFSNFSLTLEGENFENLCSHVLPKLNRTHVQGDTAP